MMTRTGSGVSLTISSSPSRRPVHGWTGSLSSRPWRCDAVTLTEFLAARLGEAEKRAGYVHDVARDAEPLGGTGHCVCGYPVRVLREVEDGRRLLAAYEASVRSVGGDLSPTPRVRGPARAAGWAPPPDYHEAGRPPTLPGQSPAPPLPP